MVFHNFHSSINLCLPLEVYKWLTLKNILFLDFGVPKQIHCDNGPQFLGPFIEFCDENCITIERSSPYNPTSNSSAERNLGILKELLKKSAHGGDDFLQQFFVLQNLPRMTGGLSPARLFFQREVRVQMFYTPPCNKDEHGAGLQRHYDRERQREVRNAKRGKGLESPLKLYVGQHVFLQDELCRGHPYSIPGKVMSIRENGQSAFVWCPGKARRLLRNHRKMRLRIDDNDDNEDDEDGEESSVEEEVEENL